jgi:2,3-bisphosphoglycerate-independent phosphoglycerate mutase
MKRVVLCILDGLGLNPNPVGNAFYHADTPCLDKLLSYYPNATLITGGERVGLPAGQMGNSEVGHLNIGAGRVVEQWLLRISNALKGSFLAESESYRQLIKNSKDGALHLIGLYSDGGVHSHKEHLHLLLNQLQKDFHGEIFLHLITDGRDTAPNSAKDQLQDLLQLISAMPNVKIASIVGRFFAMDRDKRWERVKRAYDVITGNFPLVTLKPLDWILDNYKKGVTDEFIEPASFISRPLAAVDGVIFWNFREDRMRELVSALCVPSFAGFDRQGIPFSAARTLGFTEYDSSFKLPYLFDQLLVKNHLGAVIADHSLKQLRVAETEKYPHVTYFFNGGDETPLEQEERVLIPSPREVKTYDQKPEMSAFGVRDAVLKGMRSGQYSFILVNFANCDMVGHTGVFAAAVKAVETVDQCLEAIIDQAQKSGEAVLIIADHGNAEQMVDYQTGAVFTAHTLFPVPIILFGNDAVKIQDGGALCDVAPTVLNLLEIEQPQEMSGRSLLSKKTA